LGPLLVIVAAFLLPKATGGASLIVKRWLELFSPRSDGADRPWCRTLGLWDSGTLGLWERGRKETLELLHSTSVPVAPLV
jgi:hypothetical protein